MSRKEADSNEPPLMGRRMLAAKPTISGRKQSRSSFLCGFRKEEEEGAGRRVAGAARRLRRVTRAQQLVVAGQLGCGNCGAHLK